MPGELQDTYVAALQHDLAELAPDTTLVGVVRRPTGWFNATVDENRPAVAPPDDLLDEIDVEVEDLKLAGLCDEGAHNAAWENVAFGDRYREHLETDEAQSAMTDLADRLRDGENLALVCYENTDKKRCHRTILREELAERLE